MKKITAMLVATFALLIGGVSMAHPDHDDMPPEQSLKLELAKKKDGAMVYVTNHGQRFSTVGSTGVLSLMIGQKVHEIVLKPSGENGMETIKATKIAPGTKARATVTTAEKITVSTEFVVK